MMLDAIKYDLVRFDRIKLNGTHQHQMEKEREENRNGPHCLGNVCIYWI